MTAELSFLPPPPLRFVPDLAARRAAFAVADRIRTGRLLIEDRWGTSRFGPDSPHDHVDDHAEVRVVRADAYRSLVADGGSGLGVSYARGDWDTPDLVGLLRLLAGNLQGLHALRDRWYRVSAPLLDPVRRVRRSDLRRDRRNVQAHYDLGDEFFETFLDESMTYSCAVFDGASVDLGSAQTEKLDRICRKLSLGPDDHVVEIGSGWGSFALHAASRHGCRVTTTTVSQRQYERVRQRVAAAGLTERIDVRFDHYADLAADPTNHERFDALVSIEMIEAVDWRDHRRFFESCTRMLRPTGRMALQAITIDEGRYERARVSRDFIKRHVFPGGCLPSVGSIVDAARRAGDLRLRDLEDLTEHYPTTLRHWADALDRRRDEVHGLGIDESFRRLWRFYLAYCEAGFLQREIGVVQAVFVRGAWRPGEA